MKMKIIACMLCIAVSGAVQADTRSNGDVTMSSIGDNLLVIMINSSKKILLYQVSNQGKCALKGVRTWHYDAQFANGLKTECHSGVYPRKTLVDSRANGLEVIKWMKASSYVFDPKFSMPGFGTNSAGSGSGGDLSVCFDISRTSGLYAILNMENYAILLYHVNAQGITFRSCRSIFAEVQIPYYFPGTTAKNPLVIRNQLLGMKEAIDKQKPKIPFEFKDLEMAGKTDTDKKKDSDDDTDKKKDDTKEEKKEEKKEDKGKK